MKNQDPIVEMFQVFVLFLGLVAGLLGLVYFIENLP